MNAPKSKSRRTATRVFWLVATGIVATLKVPEIAYDVGRGLAYAPTPSVLPTSIATAVSVATAWLVAGILCGLVMEEQPWYRNLYLLVPIVLFLLLTPGIR